MLRVFVDTNDKNQSEDEMGLNIQRVSFDNICSTNENIESFRKVIDQYVKNKDKVIILTLDSRISIAYNTFSPLFNNDLVEVINSSLPMGGVESLVKLIKRNKYKSLSYIKDKAERLSELMNSFYFVSAYMI